MSGPRPLSTDDCVLAAHGVAGAVRKLLSDTLGEPPSEGGAWYGARPANGARARLEAAVVDAMAALVVAHPDAPAEACYRAGCEAQNTRPLEWASVAMSVRLAHAAFAASLLAFRLELPVVTPTLPEPPRRAVRREDTIFETEPRLGDRIGTRS